MPAALVRGRGPGPQGLQRAQCRHPALAATCAAAVRGHRRAPPGTGWPAPRGSAHGLAPAREFDARPAHHHFTRVARQARRARDVPDRCLARLRRDGKGGYLALPTPLLARRTDPVGELARQLGLVQIGRGRSIGFDVRFEYRRDQRRGCCSKRAVNSCIRERFLPQSNKPANERERKSTRCAWASIRKSTWSLKPARVVKERRADRPG